MNWLNRTCGMFLRMSLFDVALVIVPLHWSKFSLSVTSTYNSASILLAENYSPAYVTYAPAMGLLS
jgi:hypothetical protein